MDRGAWWAIVCRVPNVWTHSLTTRHSLACICSKIFWILENNPRKKEHIHVFYLICAIYVFICLCISIGLFLVSVIHLHVVVFIQFQKNMTFHKYRLCIVSPSVSLGYRLPVKAPLFFPLSLSSWMVHTVAFRPSACKTFLAEEGMQGMFLASCMVPGVSHHLNDPFTEALQGWEVVNHCLAFPKG